MENIENSNSDLSNLFRKYFMFYGLSDLLLSFITFILFDQVNLISSE